MKDTRDLSKYWTASYLETGLRKAQGFVFAVLVGSLACGDPAFAEDSSVASCRSVFLAAGSPFEERVQSDFRLLGSPSAEIHAAFRPATSFKVKVRALSRLVEAILDRSRTMSERLTVLQKFVHNEYSARYVYELMLGGAYPHDRELMTAFYARNRFFKGALAIQDDPAILITSSFEKEIASGPFTDYYRSIKMTDEEWFALPEKKKLEIFATSGIAYRSRSPGILTKTALAPDFLGPLGRELNASGEAGNPVFEFRKDAYALSPRVTKDQIGTIIKDLQDLAGFHFHVAFELQNDPQEILRFRTWKRDLNEQVLFAGLEEGLFPTHITGQRDSDEVSDFFSDDKLQSTVATRGKIYGSAKREGHIKVGLEFRDATRKQRKLEDYLDSAHRSVHLAVWRNFGILGEVPLLKVESAQEFADRLVGLGFAPKRAKTVIRLEPYLALPFADFANHSVRDWKTGEVRPLSASARRIFGERRERFAEELRILATHIKQRMESEDDIQQALRWSLREWAEATRISQVYLAL